MAVAQETPAALPDTPEPAAVHPQDVRTGSDRRAVTGHGTVDILVVDDDERNRLALRALLEGLGARLVEASSGEEALRRLLKQDFALILLDLHMPGLDGLETAALVRSRERSRHTPIIFLTAFHRTEDQLVRGYELGAVDFLTKPVVPPEVLKGKVAFFIELQRKNEELARQWEMLRAAEHREHARNIEETRRRCEAEALQRSNEELERMARERARLIEELERQAEELREADRRKDQFLAMLGHELRNPLAPIMNALRLVRDSELPDPDVARSVDAADRQIRHMARLVDDLVDVSRIRSGKIELRRAPVELSQVVEGAVHAVEPLMRECSHQFTVTLPPEAVVIDGDAVRLAQVLENLLTNAAKYTDPGGRIELAAEREGDQVVVRVSDTGIGLPERLLDRVFDIFIQADQAVDRSRGGLGLGLALVRSLVELHGGSVVARSEGPGKGSHFVVTLPTSNAPPPAVASAAARRDGAHPLPALTIAVIEDNADIRETLRALLERRGHQVLEAADGARGVEAILSGRPTVALVDIGLPGADGYHVAAQVRAAGCRSLLIAMTGYGREEDRRRAIEAGFDAHLVKPVEFEELTRVVAELLHARDQAAPSPQPQDAPPCSLP